MRVRLRPVAEDDSDRLLAWRNSPEVSRYMLTDRRIEPDEHRRWFAESRVDPSRRDWIIESDDRPVGLVYLTDIDHDNRRCSWGFYLAYTADRGRGIGSSAWYLALRSAFDDLGIEKVCAEVLVSNGHVVALHESFGFRRESYLREHIHRSDGTVDVVGLALLRREWEMIRPGIERRLAEKRQLPAEMGG